MAADLKVIRQTQNNQFFLNCAGELVEAALF
jgi:hypothetical protein